MSLIIAAVGSHETVTYAQEELFRCLRAMDSSLFIDCRRYDAVDASKTGILWVGLDGSVPYDRRDDTIRIDVANGAGIITGSSERAVLIAAYRFLYELGCRFLRPGEDGEILPKKALPRSAVNVQVAESASYRHRAVCIEGAVGYEHVKNVIEWIPKVGMNGYYVQFRIPYCFFERWYHHLGSKYAEKEPVDNDDVHHLWMRLEDEIRKRGLLYHATGHGWTCEPFGISGTGWSNDTSTMAEGTAECFAMVKGKRELWGGVALNTNLCYSNQRVRDTMTDSIVAYCQEHPDIDYLHFWLADGTNNHCECENCQKHLPSDFYVLMLNELDKKLTAAGVDTKIVFLIYVDLLWEPQEYTIEHPDRFVLMFAPITRTYSKALTDFDPNTPVVLKPYVRNRNAMPASVAENVARLRNWQKIMPGDSFDFDYHLMWDHYFDPGYYECARILHEDMAKLDQIGLNGMVSCQTNRACFPTGLPMYAMARGLWDKDSTFDSIAEEYFTAAFGENGAAVRQYLATVSALFDPVWLRDGRPITEPAAKGRLEELAKVLKTFADGYLAAYGDSSADWKYLKLHSEYCELLRQELLACNAGDREEAKAKNEALSDWLFRHEPEINTVYDCWLGAGVASRYPRRLG